MNCNNPKCRTALRVKKCDSCNFIFMTHNNSTMCEPCAKGAYKKPANQSQYTKLEPQKMESSLSTKGEDNGPGMLCKICLDKPAEYLNVKCFHMSCCGNCVGSMKNTCPICRANGEFKKVFI